MSVSVDLTGQSFSRWSVLKNVGKNKNGQLRWVCRCDCGTQKTVIGYHLMSGVSKSCGCLKAELTSKAKLINMAGKKYGLWTVIKRSDQRKKDASWLCRCECGTERVVKGYNLRTGVSRSCGCNRDKATKARMTTHGEGHKPFSREYRCWSAMLKRCRSIKGKDYNLYGSRGITVCERWVNNYPAFLDDMGRCPESLTIERVDNNKGYSPENCEWATPQTQARNTRKNRLETYNGATKTIAGWADIINADYTKIYQYIRNGHNIEEAVIRYGFIF